MPDWFKAIHRCLRLLPPVYRAYSAVGAFRPWCPLLPRVANVCRREAIGDVPRVMVCDHADQPGHYFAWLWWVQWRLELIGQSS